MTLLLRLGCILSLLFAPIGTCLQLPSRTRERARVQAAAISRRLPTCSSSSPSRILLCMTQNSEDNNPPPGRVANVTEWLLFSSRSLQQYTGKTLLEHITEVRSLHDAHESTRYAILSHGTQEDPIYNYFNKAALETFQYEPEEIYQLPSRKSAPPDLRIDRAALIQASVERGFQVYTKAVRVTKYGQLFQINEGLLWNVYDDKGNRVGQTALFDRNKIVPIESSV